ncbi:MAG: hypothetical protein FWG88_02930 [Oscillospiraceae bacterium]|nr:hypothetical protein [Oscillospiraceae bacterium]
MKRRISIFTCIALCLVLLLSACNNNTGPSSSPSTTDANSQSETSSTNSESTTGNDSIVDTNDDDDDGGDTQQAGNDISAEPFIAIFDSGEYYFKGTVAVEDIETIVQTYIKDEKVAVVMEVEGLNMRVLVDGSLVYIISDDEESAMVMDVSMFGGNLDTYEVETEDLVYIGTGTAEFNGRVMRFDEYSSGDSIVMQFFMEGNNLSGIRTITEGIEADLVILEFSGIVPDSVFEIPDHYTIMEF